MSTYYKQSPINGRMIEHHLPSNVKRLKYTENELQEARADERAKVLSEVEKLVGDIYDGSDWHTGRHALVDELRTKLNQLKGEKC